MDGAIRLKVVSAGLIPTPPSGRVWFFFDEDNFNHLSIKDESGSVFDLQSALNYSDEKAQDAVGSILTDTAEIDFTYNDAANEITAALVPTSVVSGLYGSSSSVAQFNVDAKGRLTSAASVPISITSSQVSDFAEAVQDAMGTAYVNTPSVNITYNDAANEVSAEVNPSGVNHNLLLNYEANRHIDHSALSVATPSSSGLSGGGDLTATRNLSLDLNNLTHQTDFVRVPVSGIIAYYDATLSAHRRATKAQLLSQNPDLFSSEYSDFIASTLGGLTVSASGSGASAQAGTYGLGNAENAKGVLQYDTGTTATGRVGVGSPSGNQLFVQSQDFYRLVHRHALEALSTDVETFVSYPSCFTSAVAAAGFGANFVGFTYTHSVNGGRYEFRVYSGSILQASVDTGVLADVNYHVFEVTIDGASGTARGYIDGALVATVSSGVPSGPTESFGFTSKMEKSVGTTQRNSSLDWYLFEYYRSTER